MPSSVLPTRLRSSRDESNAEVVVREGGADLVAQLLTAAAPEWGLTILGPSLQQNGTDGFKSKASSLVHLSAAANHSSSSSRSRQPKFEVVGIQHVNTSPEWRAPADFEQVKAADLSTVIITGSAHPLDHAEPALDLLQRVRPRRIVHHMTRPLATGRLWDVIRSGPNVSQGVPGPDDLIVIVDADDLRAEGINLSYGLSWEATSEDFVRNLGSNGRLVTLVTCPNLIVRFGTEAVIHHRGRDAVDPKIYFDPKASEGDSLLLTKEMMGLPSAFTAGFTLGFANDTNNSIEDGIQLGFSTARNLSKLGFVADADDEHLPNYPITQIMDQTASRKPIPSTSIPSAKISSGEKWSLLDTLTGDPTEVARQIVTLGPEKALARCPVRHFGGLISVERTEQESLGAVQSIISERISNNEHAPTCIGVFGPAGSGKTFMASSIAQHFGALASVSDITTYDTRSLKLDDFTAACHGVRDSIATGSLPIVCFTNFEAVLESDGDLLTAFSTLMGEGTFLDRGAIRHLGHAILFFLVKQDPGEPETIFTPTASDFSLKRRATFQSMSDSKQMRLEDSPLMDQLHGLVRVAGPNWNGSNDKTFPIRRALIIRQIIKQKHPKLEINGVLDFDDAVLHALLLTPTFKHGIGSLEKIISASRLSNRTKFDVAALPPEEQIQLHVDGRIFMSFLRAPKLPAALREALAEGLFEAYKKQRILMAKSDEERAEARKEPSMRDWDDLPGELKESTRSQADDIPRKLRAVGCFMLNDGQVEPRGDPLEHVPRFNDVDLLMLSEMEHERFNAERLQRQWKMGPRSAKQRTTPFLVSWHDLTQEWKDVDTVMVECVPRILEGAGWRIYRMKE